MTNAGKIITLSATNGEVIWKQNYGDEQPQKILILDLTEREMQDFKVDRQIAVISKEKVHLLNPFTGDVDREYEVNNGDASEFIMVQMKETKTQFIL